MSKTGEVERFGWVHRSTVQDAACLTFVRGTDLDRLAQRFGAITEHARTLDFDEYCEEAFAHQDRYPVIGLRSVGEWTLIAEDGGFQGSRAEVLRRVSHRTEAVSAFWNVNALTQFSHAVDGELRTAFEALMPAFRQGTRPDGLEDIRAGLPWPGIDPLGEPGASTIDLMLALAARITGEPLTPDWFDGDFATYPVASWPLDLPGSPEVLLDEVGLDQVGIRFHADDLEADSAALLDAVRRAGPARCRRAAASVARHVLDLTAGHDQLVVAETLRALEAGAEPDDAAIGEVVRLRRWELHRRPVTSADRARVRALEVLRQATNRDPLTGLLGALAEAGRLRVERSDLTDLVTAALA
ncbi:DUF6461 domain-containing protein [Saccharopolyspora sp. NFXS83]|uniref:DUF6461 domain-containing protein n=1 Tax=Saccharopolyspora sp. NFXS83 TaxID=2993560 RepID=UPI00224B5AA3|nr:DUF6461 domain-containing protein [Saccharopolyspora sp. NFXS83]MCX2733957.1 DUF6461 domain-containing protein [Saccharopolyspora sp. NFXS83]